MKAKVSEQQVLDALKQCMDPEIPLSVVDLGLIYGIDIDEENNIKIKMTMTTPGCPLHNTLVRDVKRALNKVEGIKDVSVEIVWDPPWTPERMSPEAREKVFGARSARAPSAGYGSRSLRFTIDLERSRPLKQGQFVRQEDGSLVLVNDLGQGFMVNDALLEFWGMCDGSKSINEIIDEFSLKMRLPRIELEGQVVNLVQQMLDARLLKV
ncbi:MAG: PqqD family peptide modification chaperone [Candidatus Nitrosocaldus sp.]|nr:PqqD family peptide modification chaperone [Candidatus Nitrosocaldus sp.]MCS7141209.1 PqqD family peptide modification chaperone [Candidatus Nitrosocaldus sp.]MDW8000185.1 PqqD family peptide modification chaperone [Candidatus Nitrosocaldus sp.]MDW8275639.1 PqqD family peptide modification chaperone [Candidatus Nitrosocaldus sp.]